MSAPRRFRKKPVVIEAMQWDGSDEAWHSIVRWARAEGTDIDLVVQPGIVDLLEIPTLEGPMRASAGDWIIRGVQGEFYPCKPDIFEATYEEDTP